MLSQKKKKSANDTRSCSSSNKPVRHSSLTIGGKKGCLKGLVDSGFIRQNMAVGIPRTGSTAMPLPAPSRHFRLPPATSGSLPFFHSYPFRFRGQSRQGLRYRSSASCLGHDLSHVICSYLLQVVALAASLRENEQAQTRSVSDLLSGLPSLVDPL